MMTQPIRVMLADDHETVRQGLRALFASVPQVEVVDEAGDTESAVARALAVSPDLVVLDLSMPQRGGLAVIRDLKREGSPAQFIVLSRHRDQAFIRQSLDAGASGYVLKQSAFSELQRAIFDVAAGKRHIDDALLANMDEAPPQPGARVTDRERDVLKRSALGQSNKGIAASLNIAVKTVEVHKMQGMRKLGLQGRRDLIRYATLQGWLTEL